MFARRRRWPLASLAAIVLLLSCLVAAQEPRQAPAPDASGDQRLLASMHAISSHTLLAYVKEMASPKYQGRLTGTPSYDAAAQWAADLLASWVSAEVVYVGYGATAPELGYDDYEGVDVKGRIVMMEPEVPVSPDRDAELFKKWRPYSFHDKTKAMLNLESVGRGESIGAGSARNFPQVWEVIDRLNRQYIHRPVTPTANANLARPRQDAAHFLWAQVPTVSFGTTGGRPLPYATYHTSKDSPDIITPEIMEDLARLVFLATVELANKQN